MASSRQKAMRRICWSAPLVLSLIGTSAIPLLAKQAAAPIAPSTTRSFLALSDIHYGQTCSSSGTETDASLWSAAQAEGQRLVEAEKPAFAIYLGDLPTHCDGHPDSDFAVALDGLSNIAGTGTKLIYVMGNNDSLAGDYAAFTSPKGTPLDVSSVWKGGPVLNARPGDMIDAAHVAKGYYAVYAVQTTASSAALRVLALNTNMFTRKYAEKNRTTYRADTGAQLEWLNAQLKDARAKREKVIIAMHVPPGVDGYKGGSMWHSGLKYKGHDPELTHGWVQATFLHIVAAYGPEIVGLLSSHTHYNEIRRLRDCSQKLPALGAFTELDVAIPSITTDHGNNPSMKLFSYDGRFEWTENRTFYAFGQTGANWSSNPPLSFDTTNYPCPSCSADDTLKDRIASLDNATEIGKSGPLVRMMTAWLKVGVPLLGTTEHYAQALDVTCKMPPGSNNMSYWISED